MEKKPGKRKSWKYTKQKERGEALEAGGKEKVKVHANNIFYHKSSLNSNCIVLKS